MKNIALKAAWPVRFQKLLEAKGDYDNAWFYRTLPIMDARIWECNRDPKYVEKLLSKCNPGNFSLPMHIWYSWCCYNFKIDILDAEEILDTMLWGNSLILKANQPIFNAKLVNSRINKIIDIYGPVKGRFFRFDELIDRYGMVVDYLEYYSILAVIGDLAKRWKIELKNNYLTHPMDITPNVHRLKDHKQTASKVIYWQLIQDKFPVTANTKEIWQVKLNISIDEDEWWAIFPRFKKYVKPMKLQYFQYRVLMNALTTNRIRHKWDNTISLGCTFCSNECEMVIHLLHDCCKVVPLWKKLFKILRYWCKIYTIITKSKILLNNYKDKKKSLVNLLLVTMKHYIYATKCASNELQFSAFMDRVYQWYSVEKLYAYDTDSLCSIERKWKDIYY